MKKLVSLLLAVLLLVTALPAAFAEEEEGDVLRGTYTVYVMAESLTLENELPLYFFDGVEDMPWIDLEDLCSLMNGLQNDFFNETDYNVELSNDGNLFTLVRENGYFAEVDFDEDTIKFSDYNGFLHKPSDDNLLDLLSARGFNSEGEPDLFQRDMSASFDRLGDSMVLDLKDYDIHLKMFDDGGFIPLQTASDFIFAPGMDLCVLFNDEAVFMVSSDEELFDEDNAELTDLGKLYYDKEETERSQALADFGYNELCLMLDCQYGLKEKHDIRSFGKIFWQIGFDEALSSTNAKDADEALKEFIHVYLDDLHSAYLLPTWMSGGFIVDSDRGPSTQFMVNQMEKYAKLREDGMGSDWSAYEEVGNTAYITFDEFKFLAEDYYQAKEQDVQVPDTLGLVIYAHEQITRKNSPIENVVIDLTNNGGGDADAAMYIAAWIIGQAEVSIMDSYTEAQSTMVYRADVNLDRKFDEKDTLAGKHVYCITCPRSFSCGNLLPAMLKAHQAATLIGRTSGGGACIVQKMSTAWGTLIQISGNMRLSFRKNGSFYDIDEGVEPDVYIDHLETLYDREALAEIINKLN